LSAQELSRVITGHFYLHDNTLWKPIKSAKKPKQAIPPIRRQTPTDTNWAKSDKEKADLFGEHLATVFTPHSDNPDPEINRLLASIPNTNQNPNILNLHEVQDGITTLNNKKSPGPDLVTPKMLKELPRKGLVALLYIFNGVLRTQYWPKALKTAEIIVISKPGKDPQDPTSYRPIILLAIVSKVLERLFANKILTDEKYVNSLPDHRFGFRHNTPLSSKCIASVIPLMKPVLFWMSAKSSIRLGTKAYSIKYGTRYRSTSTSKVTPERSHL